MMINGKEYQTVTINGAEFLSPLQIAEIHGVDRNTVTQRCLRGKIEGAFKISRDWFIPAKGAADLPFDPQRSPYANGRRPLGKTMEEITAAIEPDKMYSKRQAAALIGVCGVTILRAIERGTLPATKTPRGADGTRWFTILIRGADILRFASSISGANADDKAAL